MLAVVWHELGHLVAGRAAGLQVIACGVGIRNPWVSKQWGGVVWYFGWLPTGGLTLAVSPGIDIPKAKLLRFISGGPTASLILLIGVWWLWLAARQTETDFVAALFWTALYMLAITAIPMQVRDRRLTLLNDAATAWHLWHGRSWSELIPPGPLLASLQELVRICNRIDCYLGSIAYTFSLASVQASLGDATAATNTLESDVLRDPRRHGWGREYEGVLSAITLACKDVPASDAALTQLNPAGIDQDYLKALIALQLLENAVERDAVTPGLVQAAAEAAQSTNRAGLRVMAQALALIADVPEDIEARAAALIGPKLRPYINPLLVLRLRSHVCQILAERGEIDRARHWFSLAVAQQSEIARGITDPATKERFLALASTRLRKAIDATPESAPLFVPLEIRPPADLQCTAFPPWLLSMLALVVGILLALGVVGSLILAAESPRNIGHIVMAVAMAGAAGWCFRSVARSWRGER